MNAAAWATLIGVGVTALMALGGLMIHVIRYAYSQGRTHQRLDAIERAQAVATETGALVAARMATVDALVAALTATVEALKGSVDRLDRAVERILGGRAPRRSASDLDA